MPDVQRLTGVGKGERQRCRVIAANDVADSASLALCAKKRIFCAFTRPASRPTVPVALDHRQKQLMALAACRKHTAEHNAEIILVRTLQNKMQSTMQHNAASAGV